MKTLINKGTLTATLLMAVSFACTDKFLEVPATGQLSGVQLTSKAGLDGLLMGAYAQLNARGFSQSASSFNWVRGSISGGEANKGSNSGDFNALTPYETYQLLPSSGEVNAKWNAMYEGIARCNSVLRSLASAGSDVTAADKTGLQAEARFLRGHYYFELKRNFNMVPFIDETV
ncbi:RagB/SusD family nutrient uptake outer membrane protein, partial [Spirosoma sp. 48-14]